ncbi:M1 family metallopeptidase [Flavobacterium humi]|uniref:Aminopeptidase N n=1 Tax=Flavobacterium humi TaxID=2562683 RepID=A0A4Z0LCF3_9FLAO|nr:M1 family metallopeptidase [Flavobacterium humi]TGD59572.1 M1 family peptidase [Flavobacterium humi]
MKHFSLLFLLFPVLCFGQQIRKVDFTIMEGVVIPNPAEKSITGDILYHFKVKSPIDTIKIDAQKMSFTSLKINGKEVRFKNTGKELLLFEGFKKGKNILAFSYKAVPKQALYFIGEGNYLQIWTQGQGKYTSHWLPSFDNGNEKVVFNLSVVFDKQYQVVSNGENNSSSKNTIALTHDKNHSVFSYSMRQPMSSYLVMMAIGKYDKEVLQSKSGIPLEIYLKPEDKDKFDATYKYSKEIFDFMEKEIGVKYPWKVYRQLPVNDFLYAGMENTSATLFSQDLVVDAVGFNDKNYINVNAHELAHQWFGDLITEESGHDHWLQEGFATYYALLAEKALFGEDHFNYELIKITEELQAAAKTDTIPILNGKASSLTFYQKGALALYMLDEKIGHENFQKAVKKYLQHYKFKNVVTENFLDEIKKVSAYDVTAFRKDWLEKPGFNLEEVTAVLHKNKFAKAYLELQKMQDIPFEQKKEHFKSLLKSGVFYPVKQEVIRQLSEVSMEDKKELLLLAFHSNDIKVRQAIAETLLEIPLELKPEYESLLEDPSYKTRQIALQNLWVKFPEDRVKLVEKSENWVGSNDKDLRITWLMLALGTPGYQPENKSRLYKEMIDYASVNYDSTIRQNALEMLLKINPTDERVLQSLVNATTHHKWQFVAFGKNTIRAMLKKEEFRKAFEALLPKLTGKEQAFLKNELK